MSAAMQNTPAGLEILDKKIDEQALVLEQWRRPSEPLLFETLRAIDCAYCEELFHPDEGLDSGERMYRSLLTWGVNKALVRMLPDELLRGPFRLFPSKDETQEKADWFLLQCGILQRAELLRGLLADGLVSARLESPPQLSPLIKDILVLKTKPSLAAPTGCRAHAARLDERAPS